MAYNKLSNYRTTISTQDGLTSVIYARTPIVAFSAGSVTLRADGWQTVTTKRKMNQASHQFGLGFGVYQKAGDWFVSKPDGETVPFSEGLTFPRKLA